SSKPRHPAARSLAEPRKLWMMSGLKTLSSKLPDAPPMFTATSLPSTCAAIMVTASDCVGLTLPGMMEEPGSFSGILSSPRPARGPEASQRTSLAIFMSEAARVFSAPWAKTRASCAASASNLFGALTKGRLVISAIFLATFSANSVWGLRPVPTAVPPQGQGHGVHEVGAADLDDAFEGLGLVPQGLLEFLHGRDELVGYGFGRGDVHGCGKGVVGALGLVHVVVGVDGFFAAHHAAGHLNGAVTDDLVGVHIGLRARSGLPDHQWKMSVQAALDDLVGGFHDQAGLVRGQAAE